VEDAVELASLDLKSNGSRDDEAFFAAQQPANTHHGDADHSTLPIESKGVAFRRFVEVPRRGGTRSSQTPGWRSAWCPS
jgi:hypothetical protein